MQHKIGERYIFCHSNECVAISFSGAYVCVDSRTNDISQNTERLNDNGKRKNTTLFLTSRSCSFHSKTASIEIKNCDAFGWCCVNCRPNCVYSEMFGWLAANVKSFWIQFNWIVKRAREWASKWFNHQQRENIISSPTSFLINIKINCLFQIYAFMSFFVETHRVWVWVNASQCVCLDIEINIWYSIWTRLLRGQRDAKTKTNVFSVYIYISLIQQIYFWVFECCGGKTLNRNTGTRTHTAHAMLSLVAAVVSNVACRRWHLISLNWNKYITTQHIGGSGCAFRRLYMNNNEYATQMIVSRHQLPDEIAYYYCYYCLLLVFVFCVLLQFSRLCSRVHLLLSCTNSSLALSLPVLLYFRVSELNLMEKRP